MRLYNPRNGAEFTTTSDDEAHVAVYLDAGWLKAPEPEARPGYAAEPVTYAPNADGVYEPVTDDKPKRARGASKAASTD